MVSEGVKKATMDSSASVLTELVDDTVIDGVQIGYGAQKRE